jgi:hypothetical protein
MTQSRAVWFAGAFTAALAVGATPASRAVAQQDTACTWDRCALRLQQGLLGPRLVRGLEGTKVVGVGLFPPRLPLFGQRSDSAGVHYLAFRSRQSGASTLLLVALGAMVAGNVIAADGHEDTGLGFVVAGFVLSLAGAGLGASAQNELSRAVWWYNRSLAMPDPPRGPP